MTTGNCVESPHWGPESHLECVLEEAGPEPELSSARRLRSGENVTVYRARAAISSHKEGRGLGEMEAGGEEGCCLYSHST